MHNLLSHEFHFSFYPFSYASIKRYKMSFIQSSMFGHLLLYLRKRKMFCIQSFSIIFGYHCISTMTPCTWKWKCVTWASSNRRKKIAWRIYALNECRKWCLHLYVWSEIEQNRQCNNKNTSPTQLRWMVYVRCVHNNCISSLCSAGMFHCGSVLALHFNVFQIKFSTSHSLIIILYYCYSFSVRLFWCWKCV